MKKLLITSGPTTLRDDNSRWSSVHELQTMHSLGRAPWPAGCVGLGGTELLDWGRYVQSGGFIAPLYFVADRGDPVFEVDGVSLPRVDLSTVPAGSYPPVTVTVSAAASAPAPAAAVPALELHRSSLLMEDSTADEALPPLPVAKSKSAVKGKRGAKIKTRVTYAEEQPEPGLTHHKEDYTRALDPGDDCSHLGELFELNSKAMNREQEEEVKNSVSAIRLRGFYIERKSFNGFGISITNIPRTSPDSPDFDFAESVIITDLAPDEAARADGKLRVNDRVVIINSQWVTCLSHAQFLLGALQDATAIDITIARGEPLPELPEFTGTPDSELEKLAFEHAGLRARVEEEDEDNPYAVGWTRPQILQVIKQRFLPASKALAESQPAVRFQRESSGMNRGDDDEDA
jgi:hypothetical protein